MMAHDSSATPPDELDQATVETVRDALVAYVGAPGTSGSLTEALHTMAAEARRKDIAPERLLVRLKEVWYSLPAVRQTPQPGDRVRLLQRVVSICIEAYYEGRG